MTTIWTIGHSNRSQREFLELLRDREIEVLVDIRRFPTSKIEHFRQEKMREWLKRAGIEYVWLGEELGGYRRGGYEQYMETPAFRRGMAKLLDIAKRKRACICCMERNPRFCHRRFISRYLERLGVEVIHLIEREQVAL